MPTRRVRFARPASTVLGLCGALVWRRLGASVGAQTVRTTPLSAWWKWPAASLDLPPWRSLAR
jgi:hypothetical protein